MTRTKQMPKFKTLRPAPLDSPIYKRGYLVGGTLGMTEPTKKGSGGRLLAMMRSASPDSPIYQSGLRMVAIREALAASTPAPDGDSGEAESPATSAPPGSR